MNRTYLWIIPIALAMPVIQLIIFFARFGNIPADLWLDSLNFIPVGLVIGLFVVWLYRRSQSRPQRWGTLIGFMLSYPFAILGALGGGLLGFIGVILYGSIPVFIGTGIGYGVGTWLYRRSSTG